MTEALEHRKLVGNVRTIKGRKLIGHAAVFNTPTVVDGFTEIVAPGAFAETLRTGGDVLALVDHDTGRLLARLSSGTLVLNEDGKGLAFEIRLPDTTLARDVLELAERGDLGGMSFGFRVPPGGDVISNGVRTLNRIELAEVSVVHAWPAYPNTTVEPRQKRDTPRLDAARAWLETIED